MGQFIATMQERTSPDSIVLPSNESMAKEKLSKVRELHMGFKMLCESFAVSLKEF